MFKLDRIDPYITKKQMPLKNTVSKSAAITNKSLYIILKQLKFWSKENMSDKQKHVFEKPKKKKPQLPADYPKREKTTNTHKF